MGAIGSITDRGFRPNDHVGAFDPRGWGTAAGGVANYAYGSRFTVTAPVVVSKVGFHVVTQNGNIDLGLYKADGVTRLGHCGSTALAAPGKQEVSLLVPVLLIPGVFYWEDAVFDGSGTIMACAPTNGLEVRSAGNSLANNAMPLPDPLTGWIIPIVGKNWLLDWRV
jgi:hypothetical protein